MSSAATAPSAACRWLDVAVEERATGLIFLRVHPRLDRIRRDPRYLRRVGLDAGWGWGVRERISARA